MEISKYLKLTMVVFKIRAPIVRNTQCSGKVFVKYRVDFCSENYRDFEVQVKENLVIISNIVWLIMKNFQKFPQNYGRILEKF